MSDPARSLRHVGGGRTAGATGTARSRARRSPVAGRRPVSRSPVPPRGVAVAGPWRGVAGPWRGVAGPWRGVARRPTVSPGAPRCRRAPHRVALPFVQELHHRNRISDPPCTPSRPWSTNGRSERTACTRTAPHGPRWARRKGPARERPTERSSGATSAGWGPLRGDSGRPVQLRHDGGGGNAARRRRRNAGRGSSLERRRPGTSRIGFRPNLPGAGPYRFGGRLPACSTARPTQSDSASSSATTSGGRRA